MPPFVPPYQPGPLCARTCCSRATRTISCAMTKSSSSTERFTGRMMPGRLFSGRVAPGARSQGKGQNPAQRTRPWPQSPSRTISASTKKLAGMTGTASTEAEEFADIYKLDVAEIPTKTVRSRASTRMTRSIARVEEKYEAIIREIAEASREGASPTLVGTHPRSRNPRFSGRTARQARLQADRFRETDGAGAALRGGARRA